MTTTIHIDDYRLSDQERALLKKIADRLDAWRDYQPVQPLPEGLRRSLEEMLRRVKCWRP